MRVYAEALETDVEEGTAPEFIRLDATNKDFSQVLADLRDLLHSDKKYELRKHYCRHDTNESCWTEPVS